MQLGQAPTVQCTPHQPALSRQASCNPSGPNNYVYPALASAVVQNIVTIETGLRIAMAFNRRAPWPRVFLQQQRVASADVRSALPLHIIGPSYHRRSCCSSLQPSPPFKSSSIAFSSNNSILTRRKFHSSTATSSSSSPMAQLDPEQAYQENGARPASTWLGHRGNAAFDLRSKFSKFEQEYYAYKTTMTKNIHESPPLEKCNTRNMSHLSKVTPRPPRPWRC